MNLRSGSVAILLILTGCSSSPASDVDGSKSHDGGGQDGGPVTDASLPHSTGSCTGLAAVGTWEQIAPPTVDLTTGNGLLTVRLDPTHSGTIFASADHQGMYRSDDCGATWTKINTGMHGADLDTGSQWVIRIDPRDSMSIYAGNLYGQDDSSLWKSTNGGVDWVNLFPPGSMVADGVDGPFFQDVDIDPTNPDHLVASFHNQCRHPTDPAGQYNWMCMGESMDDGMTWSLFTGPTASWTEAARPVVIGGSTFLYIAVEGGIWYTADDGGHWEQEGPGATDQIYHAQNGTDYLPTLYGIHSSTDEHLWTAVMGAPNSVSITGDGIRLFSAQNQPPMSATDPSAYSTSAETDGSHWTDLAPPPALTSRIVQMVYDADHHLLYSANTHDGLFRMVTH